MDDQSEVDRDSAKEIVGFLGRHLVVLACDFEVLKPDGSISHRDVAVYCGFLLELHDYLFWVTAGHCLKDDLDARIFDGSVRVVGGGFMDYFGHEASHWHLVPFIYECGRGFYVEQPKYGLDYALIALDSLKAKALAANGVKVVSRHNWIHQPNIQFDFYRMLGIPKDQVHRRRLPDGTVDVQVRPVLAALHRIDRSVLTEWPSGMTTAPSDDWFIGRLDPQVDLETLEGMSGGPIYGFRRNAEGQLTYHVVALQSRWWTKSRTIFGCSVPLFAEQVHEMLGDIIKGD